MYNIRENYVVNDIMFPRKLYQYNLVYYMRTIKAQLEKNIYNLIYIKKRKKERRKILRLLIIICNKNIILQFLLIQIYFKTFININLYFAFQVGTNCLNRVR